MTFLDSSGIGVIISACKRVRASGGTLSVTCGSGSVRRSIEIMGLVDYLEVQ